MDKQIRIAKISRKIYRATFKTGMFKWKIMKIFEPGFLLMKKYLVPEGDTVVLLPKKGVIEVNENVSKQDVVLPPQVLDHFIEKSSYRAIMNYCFCRDANECKDYPVKMGCLFMGKAAKDIHPDQARPATKEEAREHIRKAREAGLIQFVGKFWGDSVWLGVSPHEKLFTVCNCCPCCCISIAMPYMHPEFSSILHKMPGISICIGTECVGCGLCLDACIFGGMKLDGDRAVITESCRCCGRCVETCPQKAISINIDDPDYVKKTIEFLEPRVDVN